MGAAPGWAGCVAEGGARREVSRQERAERNQPGDRKWPGGIFFTFHIHSSVLMAL